VRLGVLGKTDGSLHEPLTVWGPLCPWHDAVIGGVEVARDGHGAWSIAPA
jgi:hypothetical protein